MFGTDQEEVFLGRDFNNTKNYSDEIAAVIDLEVKRIIDTGYDRAKSILNQNMRSS
jgi:cell division protease FtsH